MRADTVDATSAASCAHPSRASQAPTAILRQRGDRHPLATVYPVTWHCANVPAGARLLRRGAQKKQSQSLRLAHELPPVARASVPPVLGAGASVARDGYIALVGCLKNEEIDQKHRARDHSGAIVRSGSSRDAPPRIWRASLNPQAVRMPPTPDRGRGLETRLVPRSDSPHHR